MMKWLAVDTREKRPMEHDLIFGLWLEWWPTKTHSGLARGRYWKFVWTLGGRKTEAENQKPKGKTRKRAIERERWDWLCSVRLIIVQREEPTSKRKKTRICLCVTFGLLLFFLNPDDDYDFSSFCNIKKYRNLRKIKPMMNIEW